MQNHDFTILTNKHGPVGLSPEVQIQGHKVPVNPDLELRFDVVCLHKVPAVILRVEEHSLLRRCLA